GVSLYYLFISTLILLFLGLALYSSREEYMLTS
ncbi:ABC transporter permease, partial [Escherichia coli]|nr:ABC transporter permease [Escherichia coli]